MICDGETVSPLIATANPMLAINAIISVMYPEASGLEEGAELPPEMMKSVPTIQSLNAMMPMVNEFLNSVNNRNRKGWPPAEQLMARPMEGPFRVRTLFTR